MGSRALGAFSLLVLTVAVPAASASAQTAQQSRSASNDADAVQSSWVRPSDAAYTFAINDGFAQKHSKHKYVEFWKAGIQFEPTSMVEGIPPLYCAYRAGRQASNKLEQMPSVQAVRSECDGVIDFFVIHYSTELDAHYRLVLDLGSGRMQPTASNPDGNPSVVKFMGGLFVGYEVGYKYIDSFTFALESVPTAVVTVLLADEDGKRKTYSFDPRQFAAEETQLSSASAASNRPPVK